MTWSKPGWCWQPSNGAECLNYSAITYSIRANQVLGNWSFEVLFYDAFTEESIYAEDFHIVGHTLQSVGDSVISGQVDTVAKTPIKTRLVDYDGVSGVSGRPVTFTINSVNGSSLVPSYSTPPGGSSSLTVTTDASGIAEVFVSLGSTEEPSTVNVSAVTAPINPPYFTTPPVFTANGLVEYIPEYEVPDLDQGKNLGEIKKGGCAGNPINIVTGNKFQKETDLTGLSASPLGFSRYYNAKDSSATTLGRGWRHNFQRTITFTKEGQGQSAVSYATLARPDGKSVVLTDTGAGWAGDADVYYQLIKKAGKWELYTQHDTVELYSGKGKLLSITDIRGNTQTLSYDNQKQLTQVTTNSNEKLLFAYNAEGYLVSVTYWASNPDPTQEETRQWSYAYTNGNLSSVTNPDGTQRLYHYEDIYNPWSLTGITDERGERYAVSSPSR